MTKCPECGFEQELAADRLCPQCGKAVPLPPRPVGDVTTGSRAAGVVLLLNAAVNAASAFLVPSSGPGGLNPAHGIVVDVIFGVGLMIGREKWHKWGFVRAILGGVIFGGIFAASGEWWSFAFQLMLSTSLVLLLLGSPGKLRIAGAGLLCAPYFLFALIGLAATKTGTNPIAAAILAAKGNITPAAGTIRGVKQAYCFELPEKNWYLRGDAVAHKDSPLSDRWVTRPDLDAHVMVIAEEVPGANINQKRYEDALEENARETLSNFQMLSRDEVLGGSALHYSGKMQQLNLEYYRGAFTDGSRAYQVIGFSTTEHFAKARTDLTAIVKSFRSRCDSR